MGATLYALPGGRKELGASQCGRGEGGNYYVADSLCLDIAPTA